MDRKLGRLVRFAVLSVGLLLGAAPAFPQEVRLVEGHVYSFKDASGTRYYLSSPPPGWAEDVRRLKYSYYERLESSSPARSFAGFTCRQDCSGHRAGYEWARDKGIRTPSRCGGRSQSFIEGCRAYAEGRTP